MSDTKKEKEHIPTEEELEAMTREARIQALMRMMDPGAGCTLDATKAHPSGGHLGMVNEEPPEPEDKPKIKTETQVTADAPTPEDDLDEKGAPVWGDTPTFKDQYAKYPNTCRLIGPQMAVFDVTDEGQLSKLNKLLALQRPEEAPGIIVVTKEKNFHEGKWLVLLEYFRLEYKHLISTS